MLGDENSDARGNTPISLIGIHTSQGVGTARNLADYCLRSAVSYHTIISPGTTFPFVSEHRAAWSMRRANPFSLNLCFVGYAEWTDADWILNHHGMLRDAAIVVRGWAKHYGIPIRKLTVDQVFAGERGIIAHHDWTLSEKRRNPKAKDSHWDPGTGFPWKAFIQLCQEDDEMQLTDRITSKLNGNSITVGDLLSHWDKWIVDTYRLAQRLDRLDEMEAKIDQLLAREKTV